MCMIHMCVVRCAHIWYAADPGAVISLFLSLSLSIYLSLSLYIYICKTHNGTTATTSTTITTTTTTTNNNNNDDNNNDNDNNNSLIILVVWRPSSLKSRRAPQTSLESPVGGRKRRCPRNPGALLVVRVSPGLLGGHPFITCWLSPY